MTDEKDTPTGGLPTPEEKPADKPTEKPQITPDIQAIIDKAIQDRLGREKKNHEKRVAELEAKIQDYETKDLGEIEKLQKKIEKLTKDLGDKDTELTGMRLKDAKVEALLMAGALSEQIPKLLKRVSGTTPEEIAADVEELKALGWIGKPPVVKGATGSGHQPVSNDSAKTFTRAQIKKMSPEEYEANREAIMKAMQAGEIKGD